MIVEADPYAPQSSTKPGFGLLTSGAARRGCGRVPRLAPGDRIIVYNRWVWCRSPLSGVFVFTSYARELGLSKPLIGCQNLSVGGHSSWIFIG